MTELADQTHVNFTNIVAFVPRRKRPRVCVAIRADFKLEEISFDSFLRAPTNTSAREMTEEQSDG